MGQFFVSSIVTDYLNDLQPGLTKLLKQDDGTTVEHFVHGVRGIHAVDDGNAYNLYRRIGFKDYPAFEPYLWMPAQEE